MKKVHIDFTNNSSFMTDFINQSNSDNSEHIKKVKEILKNIIANELTSRQREIIMLYYYEKKKSKDIATLLGIDKSTVSCILSSARKKIYNILKYYI